MDLTAVTGYELSLSLHITAVVVGFGATFAEAVTFPVAMQLSPRHLPYVHRLQLAINTWLATPALVIVLATGLYQTADGDWDFGAFWISATLLIVLIIGGLLGAYFIPADRRLGRWRSVRSPPPGTPSRSCPTSTRGGEDGRHRGDCDRRADRGRDLPHGHQARRVMEAAPPESAAASAAAAASAGRGGQRCHRRQRRGWSAPRPRLPLPGWWAARGRRGAPGSWAAPAWRSARRSWAAPAIVGGVANFACAGCVGCVGCVDCVGCVGCVGCIGLRGAVGRVGERA